MIEHLDELVSNAALKFPQSTAIIEKGRTLTYKELDEKIDMISSHLISKELGRGDRVGIFSRNSSSFIAVYFAVCRAGGIAVPLNHTLGLTDLTKQSNDCGISSLYVDGDLAEKGKKLAEGSTSLKSLIEENSREDIVKFKSSGIKAEDPSSIIYTSGTTADPMGVTLSHKNIISNSASIVKYMSIRPSDIICCVLPFYYIFGLSLLFSYFYAGGKVVIENGFMYPNTVLNTIEREKATAFAGVSSHYVIMLYNSDFRNRKLASLKVFIQAGDPMPARITKELKTLFPQKEIYLMYGQTEASPRLTYLPPPLAAVKPNSVGRPIPGVEIRIIDEKGASCKAGKEGEIIAKGDNVMLGYWNKPEETAETIREGWLHTGDVGFKDKDGDIFITGRRKNFIKIGANRVNPLEIEQLTMEIDGVLEAAAIGIPDDILGQKVKLFVSLTPGSALKKEDILRICKERLPSYKVPAELSILDFIPKNSYDKINKSKLS